MTSNGQIHLFISQISGRINRLEEYALQMGLEEPVSAAEIKIIEAIGLSGSEKMSSVAAQLGIAMATLTVSCDKLEARGFIARRRESADKRTVRIALTDKGAVAYRFHSSFVESLIDIVLTDLNDEERATLRRCIGRLNNLFAELSRD